MGGAKKEEQETKTEKILKAFLKLLSNMTFI